MESTATAARTDSVNLEISNIGKNDGENEGGEVVSTVEGSSGDASEDVLWLENVIEGEISEGGESSSGSTSSDNYSDDHSPPSGDLLAGPDAELLRSILANNSFY